MKKRFIYIQVFAALAIGFVVTRLLIKNVFVADTPKIQPKLARGAKNTVAVFLGGGKYSISKLSDAELTEIDAARNTALQPLNGGVYAAEDSKRTYTIIKQNEVEWIEYSFIVNRKTVKIKVPRGATPPTQETVEKLY